jgi:MinD superfamily P-loop ATPase
MTATPAGEIPLFFALRAETPCCHRPVRFAAVSAVPRERYERVCRGCGACWQIERRTGREFEGGRIDLLEWGM